MKPLPFPLLLCIALVVTGFVRLVIEDKSVTLLDVVLALVCTELWWRTGRLTDEVKRLRAREGGGR